MTKRLTTDALLLTAALIIFIIEAQIPPVVPVPGVKLGLANIITVYAIRRVGPKDAFLILIARIILGSVFAGQMVSFLYSLGGGLLCFAAMLLVRRILKEDQLWVASVIGAIFHNIGQTIVAIAVFGTVNVAFYFPVLLLSGIVTGVFTGVAAQALVRRMNGKIKP
jgi:heptaprenyl diphosphate synthase